MLQTVHFSAMDTIVQVDSAIRLVLSVEQHVEQLTSLEALDMAEVLTTVVEAAEAVEVAVATKKE